MTIRNLWARGVNHTIDTLIYGLSVVGVPVVIGVVTLIALVAWEPQFRTTDAIPLTLSVLEDADAALDPALALARLEGSPTLGHKDTRLSEAPFWFRFTARATDGAEHIDIELPSRHAIEAACWNAATLASLGRADRSAVTGPMKAIKAGFAVDLGNVESAVPVICRARYSGPARISVLQWPSPRLYASAEQFHRNTGLLEGGLLVLSAFVLVTAIINREWLYVLFAAWLLASLRMGAISAGWDTHWLERTIPPDWIFGVRKMTIAAYVVLTWALFSRLFRDDLRQVGFPALRAVAQWVCVLLVAAALVLPFSRFLPFMWAAVAVGIAVIVFLLARILLVTRSRVAMWYSTSLAIVLFAGIYEVLAASLGVKEFIGAINNVTSALCSSLLAALAIAEQMRQERHERMQAQAELHSTYEAIPIGLFTLDRDGGFLRVNPALTEMLGVDPAREPRRYWSDFFERGSWGRLQDTVRAGAGQEIDIRSAGENGNAENPKWFHVKASLTSDKLEGSLQDITERHKATERLHFLAENDPLTGVLNRRGIEKILERARQELAAGRSLALAYLDLDRFKLINDLFGHIAGDEVLRQVCRRIEDLLTDGHELGRIGGDEFVIVFQGTPIRAAAAICRGIVEAIGGSSYQIGDTAFQVKGSIGLIELTDGTAIKDSISMADRACRAAKGGHHDGLVVYEAHAPAFLDRKQELRLIGRLGAGTAPEGLFLVMQPIMSLRAPFDSLNFEVLVRMRETDNSVVPAGAIISAAENNGRAAVIDRWVLLNTLAWLERHHARLRATRFVCMNLSGASLNDEKFIQDAFAMLAQHRHAAERLCVEITEGVALHDLENTRRFIDRVRGFGAKVALDDFGAGYTSFSYLKELPADAVKIDGSFILGVNTHPANLAIVAAIVELGRNLGMKSIAEWAEDRATVEALSHVGVDYVQGYAIGRPQNPEDILCAESSASFIADESVAQFVRDSMAPAQAIELWDPLGGRSQAGIH